MAYTLKEKYTIHEISQLTGITDRTLRKHIRNGVLCGEMVEGKWIFTYEQVRAFIANQDMEPTFRRVRSSLYSQYTSRIRIEEPIRFVYLDIPLSDEDIFHSLVDIASISSSLSGVVYCFYISKNTAHVTYCGGNESLLLVRQFVFEHYPKLKKVLGD